MPLVMAGQNPALILSAARSSSRTHPLLPGWEPEGRFHCSDGLVHVSGDLQQVVLFAPPVTRGVWTCSDVCRVS